MASDPRIANDPRIAKRLVFLMIGYEPAKPERQHQRFDREIRRFETAWGVKSEVSPAEGLDGHLPNWRVETTAPDWRVETEVRLFDWHDIVARDFLRSEWARLFSGVAAMVDFAVSGTLVRYLRCNLRYGLFFLYPLVLLALITAASVYAGVWYSGAAAAAPFLGWPAGFTVFWVLYRLACSKLYLAYILDDWTFARDLVRGRRPEMTERLAEFTRAMEEAIETTDADEILVVGHSLGAPLMLHVLGELIAGRDDQPRRPLSLMTIGSSILKIGLHPAASDLREEARRVASCPKIFWVEYQAKVDAINFYKCNPVTTMDVEVATPPEVRTVRIRNMLEEATYKRFRTNFFRLHRQFVMGNERRYHYDYFMILCGPVALRARVLTPDAATAAPVAEAGAEA